MLGRRAVVLGGERGARVFYDEDVVERKGAVPPPLAWLLFGRGAVHGLDDGEHQARKTMFLDLLGPAQVAVCADLAEQRLRTAVDGWGGRRIDLQNELVESYGAAALTWAGVDAECGELRRRSHQYARIVDGFGFSPTYPRSWVARVRTDRWARRLIRGVRAGRVAAKDRTVLAVVAASDLDDRVAAVEFGNVVRPTIAVSWLGVHAALALSRGLAERADLAGSEGEALWWSFAQEVRRTAPFVPVLAGRVRQDATHDGVHLRRGDRVILDVRGINLDPARYDDALAFRASRFLAQAPSAFDLVPQGGGRPEGHRCPGESLTLQLLVRTIQVLAGLDLVVEAPVGLDRRRVPTPPLRSVMFLVGSERTHEPGGEEP